MQTPQERAASQAKPGAYAYECLRCKARYMMIAPLLCPVCKSPDKENVRREGYRMPVIRDSIIVSWEQPLDVRIEAQAIRDLRARAKHHVRHGFMEQARELYENLSKREKEFADKYKYRSERQ